VDWDGKASKLGELGKQCLADQRNAPRPIAGVSFLNTTH
jgi:hypothetical protein